MLALLVIGCGGGLIKECMSEFARIELVQSDLSNWQISPSWCWPDVENLE